MDVNTILQKRLDVFEKEALERIKQSEKDAEGAVDGFRNSVKAFREELERISALKLIGSAIELFEQCDGNMLLIKFSGKDYKRRHNSPPSLSSLSLEKVLDDIRDEHYRELNSKSLDLDNDYDLLIIPLKREKKEAI